MIDQGSEFKKPGVVGAGAWGTALAELIARHKKPVKLWAFEDEVIQSISQAHENKALLAREKPPPVHNTDGGYG